MRLHRAAFVILGGLASGCFAVFSLDGYGPPGELVEGGVVAPSDGGGGSDAADVEVPGHVVFVTSTTSQGDLGGIDGGDLRCQLVAVDAGLSGDFIAWLGDSTSSPTTRVSSGAGPVRLRNGQIVASTFGELFASGPRVGIDVDEHRQRVPAGGCDGGIVAWTGIAGDGGTDSRFKANCSDWRSNGTAGAIVGSVGAKGFEWSFACGRQCNTQAALYCVER